MATIRKETLLDCTAEEAWAALRDFGAAGRLFAPVLTDCRADGEVRQVTFAVGLVVHERRVTADDAARRFVYTVEDGPFTHHSAAMEILPEGHACRFVWTSDFLPDEVAPQVEPLIQAGVEALARNLAGGAAAASRAALT